MRLNKLVLVVLLTTGGMSCQKTGNTSSLYSQGLGESASIVGGETVEAADPVALSTVALYFNPARSNRVMNFCTGTIVTGELVLTAAHCLVDVADDLKVSLDELKDQILIGFGTQIVTQRTDSRVRFISLRSLLVHQDYKISSVQNASKEPMYDIALVRLSERIPEGYRVARLATDESYLTEGQRLTLAGYGLVNGVTQEEAKNLQKVEVRVTVPKLTSVQFAYHVVGGKSACSGDSGGPAYAINARGHLVVVGVTSWGDQFCKLMGVYTSVPALSGWIHEAFKLL